MSFPAYHPNDFVAVALMDRRFSLPDFDYLSHQQQQPVFEYGVLDRRMSMPLGSSLQQFHFQSYAGMVSEGQRMFTNQDTRYDTMTAMNIPPIGETFELLTPISLPASDAAAEPVIEPGTSKHLLQLINKPEPGLDLVLALPPNALNSPDSSETTTSRFKPTPAQLEFLMRVFEKNPFPSTALCTRIGATMCRDAKNVRFWFQNRRATLKLKGVHAVKPKRGRGRTSTVGKKIAGMTPVSGNGFFYSSVCESSVSAVV
ncbi:hypothetical protein BJ741DRAFT_627047 [Chytriomyces cf. hyalinus JEL632]|nr:hypothetical protein BJ741DRAFT_627047 [Chytriomyces cf. hyalinus JEL632]